MKTAVYVVIRLEVEHPAYVSFDDIKNGLRNTEYRLSDEACFNFVIDIPYSHVSSTAWVGTVANFSY